MPVSETNHQYCYRLRPSRTITGSHRSTTPDLYIDCLIAAASPNPYSAGVGAGGANGIALGTQAVQCVGVLHRWLLLLGMCAFSPSSAPAHSSTLPPHALPLPPPSPA